MPAYSVMVAAEQFRAHYMETWLDGTADFDLAEGDYVELMALQNRGGNLDLAKVGAYLRRAVQLAAGAPE